MPLTFWSEIIFPRFFNINGANSFRIDISRELLSSLLEYGVFQTCNCSCFKLKYFLRLTPHITGIKKQSDEGAELFDVRVHVIVRLSFGLIFEEPAHPN